MIMTGRSAPAFWKAGADLARSRPNLNRLRLSKTTSFLRGIPVMQILQISNHGFPVPPDQFIEPDQFIGIAMDCRIDAHFARTLRLVL